MLAIYSRSARRALARPLALAAAVVLAAAACSPASSPDGAPAGPPVQSRTTPDPATDPTPGPTSPAAEPTTADTGPEDSFRAWLAASRAPDATTACAYLTDELVERMVDEMTATGFPGVTDCRSMIETTAPIYAALGSSAEVVIEVRERTADRAVLGVTYVSGTCGSVEMVPRAGRWVMTENAEEEC